MNRVAVLLLALPLISAAPPSRAAAAKKPPRPGSHSPAAGAPLRHLGGAGLWQAYSFRDKSGLVCYLVGDPKKSEPAKLRRRPPVAMVTHRPQEKVFDVVSFTEGYPLKAGTDVGLDIDGAKFALFTKGDTAWARTSDLDKTIVAAIAKGRDAVATGTPQKGPTTIDTYSLAGFTHALQLVDKACGAKR